MRPSGPVATVAADGSQDAGPVTALPTRHRAGAPTSAIDLAMAPGEPVVAPISGEVVEVAEYALYGTTPVAAAARQLPFESQVDRFTAAHRGDAAPHVHIELQRV